MLRFVDLFAGLGGFHLALERLGARCVFASEIDPVLRGIYTQNFPSRDYRLVGDIRQHIDKVPDHEILCGGFPCQAFSKSGYQLGVRDPLRGTLHLDILKIIEKRRPSIVLLENVGNFERHDDGRTWQALHRALLRQGYTVTATGHRNTGGPGLLSPHHLGLAQNRERFYVLATLFEHPYPVPNLNIELGEFAFAPLNRRSLTMDELAETALSDCQEAALDLWHQVVRRFHDAKLQLPSFPLWTDEFGATYPFIGTPPGRLTAEELRRYVKTSATSKRDILGALPSYARGDTAFPTWKQEIIRQNRAFFEMRSKHFGKRWLKQLRELPSSYRKLEWNCKSSFEDLCSHTLQFRPSGIRVSSPLNYPTIVAMTPSQVPIVGSQRRYLTAREALQLQGFPADWKVPSTRADMFKAIGNAVHSAVVRSVVADILRLIQKAA